MIKPGEIQRKAREVGVRDQQIEKDYILSWILQGIALNKQLYNSLIFKGGTVLKKVYFEDYRFSEDLDFTYLNDENLNETILSWFNDVFDFVGENANIPLKIIDHNEHADGSINFYISYVGPLGGFGANKKIKVDISRTEKLVFRPIFKSVILSFSDLTEHQLLCYSLEEILIEKLRSVMQRMQARDFYDIWYLLEFCEMNVDFYKDEFHRKCVIKELNAADFLNKLHQRIPQYKARWNSSLSDQIQVLPEFDEVERQVMRNLRNVDFK
ncbi:MAG: nucleotidyl transferase AbiEii/AbiGii toxin family protein [Bacteroidetes bacterium]|nr:nucleotidyl transferase AbiEii/AbiGii toxin family protein [Bacteroidota bacterium]